ncbi:MULTISPECIES: hypothetical protein [Arthrobacter]|uniref:DUF998 domain-containing protein n=2 Tax=Arthrobacter TaxID=1663 RepID=A0ABU9KLP8_9MICC|nr:hypothetical protein [Arthrobacter sp. YJM1]MDP5228452.1 hypothetical protein [Arthrobacter sp. YJM1]
MSLPALRNTTMGTAPQRSAEERSLQAAGGALAVGFVVGFIVFFGTRRPLSGEDSIGAAAGAVSALISLAAFGFVAWRHVLTRLKDRTRLRWLYVLDVVALALAHAALSYMGAVALFAIFQQAFIGLTLDAFAAALLMAMATGLTAYLTSANVQSLTTERVATLMAVFLTLGVLDAMMNTSQSDWWHSNISALGTAHSGTASTFNITLVVAGALIVALAHFILADLEHYSTTDAGAVAFAEIQTLRQKAGQRWLQFLGARRWAERVPQDRYVHPRLRPVYGCLVLMGAGLALAGFIPVDESELLHNTGATGMVLAWAVLVVSLPWWIPGLGFTFHVTSAVFVAGVTLSALLYLPLHYYNLTAMELIAFAMIMTWLILFIRQVASVPEPRGTAAAQV